MNSNSERNDISPQSSFDRFDIGDLVFLRADGSKHESRSRYIVIGFEDGMCLIRKLCKGSTGLHSYKVKPRECIKVPCNLLPLLPSDESHNPFGSSSSVRSSFDPPNCSVQTQKMLNTGYL